MTALDHFVNSVSAEHSTVSPVAEMAQLWHPERNGSLRFSDLSPGSRRKVWWRCSQGHDWQAALYSLKAGTACPYCSGRDAIPGETDLATTHPQLLPLWSSRNTLTPDRVTPSSHRKVWWICAHGHEWEAVVGSVAMGGSGCPYCAGKRAIPGETDLATLYPALMEQWDFRQNDIDPKTVTPSSHNKVWWRCELDHSWQAAVFSRTREQAAGCPYCTGRMVLPGFNDLATVKPKLAKQWYQPLNILEPQDVTPGSNKKVWWQCSEGHVWQACVYARTRRKGSGCPICAGCVRTPEPKQRQKKRIHSRPAAVQVSAGGHV